MTLLFYFRKHIPGDYSANYPHVTNRPTSAPRAVKFVSQPKQAT